MRTAETASLTVLYSLSAPTYNVSVYGTSTSFFIRRTFLNGFSSPPGRLYVDDRFDNVYPDGPSTTVTSYTSFVNNFATNVPSLFTVTSS